MNTQISRNTFVPAKRYSAVYQQMGRMLTDADWNEFSDLEKARLADVLTDIIGSGTPRGRGIVHRLDNGDGTTTDSLRWGHAYVDGIVAQLRPDPDATLADPAGVAFEYDKQADFPVAPEPAGDHLLYLDVWERTVTMLEDGDLRDAGLHGADTCTRTQTMAQVKWCPQGVDPEDPDQNPPIGGALLSLALREGSTEPDPCDPCADEIALQDKVGNYLFRVEIHDVQYDGGGAPARLTLKWSRENGAEQSVIGDAPPGFESDKWSYEFFSGEAQAFASEKHLGLHLAPGFTPTREAPIKSYPDTPPAGTQLVRRWDGYCVLEKNGGNWEFVEGNDVGVDLSSGSDAASHAHISEGSSVAINLDAITLEIELGDHPLLAGDYWQAEVRQAVHVANSVLLENAAASGIRHHYLTLGSVSGGDFTAFDAPDCKRFEFPPLTDIRADDVCYSNEVCEMPGVETVQEAIDHLCRTQDLKWHHKHLHGWGIVCGLIAECCDRHGGDEEQPEEGEEQEDTRRTVCVTPGHALTCEGDRVSLEQNLTVPVLKRVEALQEAGEEILDEEGNGSVCLRLEPGPEVVVEAYDSDRHKQSMFDGTLLMDFYQHCVLDLVEALKGEFAFLDGDELDEVEGGSTGLVSNQRRRLTSVLNLIVQLFNNENGSYVFLSHKEHLILRDLYLRLRDLLKSKTFCAMFQDDEFPEYPFREFGMSTYFGKNSHTRVKVHPSGKSLYTYGGTDNTINVYDVETEELVQVIQMPAAEGAEVTSIAFTPDGESLFAAASVRQVDTVFGVARVAEEHKWRDMTILCDILIAEMAVDPKDPGLIYAVGKGKGLYFLRPELFLDELKPQPEAAYAFDAAGHMAIEVENATAYCTSRREANDESEGVYNEIVACDLDSAEENQQPQVRMPLIGFDGGLRSGRDGIAIRPRDADGNGFLFVITGDDGGKRLDTYGLPLVDGETNLQSSVEVENTQIALAYHHGNDRLLLAMEDGYRVQVFRENGEAGESFRVPVQIQPTDLAVADESGHVYTLNFISNTLSLTPADALNISTEFLNQLADYRTAILNAFFSLFGNLLQYLKDCFCHHLLVKCPSCDDEAIYLATVEIRDNEVYKICNFDKRKYVKSFPTMGYWFSLIPIWPLLKSAVGKLCCAVLPDFFGKYRDDVVRQPDRLTADTQFQPQENFVKANTARQSIQTYQRTDFGLLARDQTKSLKLNTQLARDNTVSFVQSNQVNQPGIKKQSLIQARTDAAVMELEKNNITIAEIQEYDAAKAGSYRSAFNRTPQRIPPGSEVTLVQRDGKVVYYALKQPEVVLVSGVSESLKKEIARLEERKTALSDFSDVKAELAQAETRRADLENVSETKAELEQIQADKAAVAAELAAIKSQVEDIKSTRLAEEQRLAQISDQRQAISADLETLNNSLQELDSARREIALEVEKQRPISGLQEVDSEMQATLREAGFLTINDLAQVDANKLVETTGITKTRANQLIKAAGARLK